MRNRYWTQDKRKFVYFSLLQSEGAYNIDTWNRTPEGVSRQEMIDGIYTEIFHKLGREFDRTPKSPAAIEQQVAWCLTQQARHRLSPAQLKMQNENRMAAYESGFLSMSDIFFLEAEGGSPS